MFLLACFPCAVGGLLHYFDDGDIYLLLRFCGVVPLAIASGAGAESRRAIGAVIVGGLSLAFVLTLLITPVIYVLIEGLRRKPAEEAAPVAAE